jgi:cell wall assembly regulator SMI1
MEAHKNDITLRPPVSPAAMANFAAKSGVMLPTDLLALLQIADGETRSSAGLIGNWRLMSVQEIQGAWGLLTQLNNKGAFTGLDPKNSPYLRKAWWHPTWIPIVSSDTGHYFCLDTDPPEPQRQGQIILFLHDRPERVLVAASLSDWFHRIARDLDQGLYTYDPELGFNGEAFMWSALEGKHIFDRTSGKLIVDKQ